MRLKNKLRQYFTPWKTSVIGPAIGRGAVSLALDGKGDAHIVYYSGDGELMWIHKSKNQ